MITEAMTVNALLKVYPWAGLVFRTFKIDWEVDGSYSLDELCWWRGIDLNALVAALRQHVALERVETLEMATV